jgi:hypothetical protein
MPRAAAELGRALGAIAIFTTIMVVALGLHAALTLSSFHSGSAVLSALLQHLF